MQNAKPVRMGYEGKAGEASAGVGENLWTAHAAGAKALEFAAGHNREDYARNDLLRAAVARMLIILLEALKELQCEAPESWKRLDGATTALALQPMLMTEDQTTSNEEADEAVWSFVQSRLPGLVGSLAAELESWHGN